MLRGTAIAMTADATALATMPAPNAAIGDTLRGMSALAVCDESLITMPLTAAEAEQLRTYIAAIPVRSDIPAALDARMRALNYAYALEK